MPARFTRIPFFKARRSVCDFDDTWVDHTIRLVSPTSAKDHCYLSWGIAAVRGTGNSSRGNIVSDPRPGQKAHTRRAPAHKLPDESAESRARRKLRALWQSRDLFH